MKKQNNRIAIITCYIGKLPWYFEYFNHTCKYNLEVDFIIITNDKTYKKQLSPNIYFIYKDLEELNDLATEKLGFKTHIDSPYKLCDFKPTYGLLFSDILKSYDFWGHGDIDLIFGKIRNFITDEVLANNDVIAVRNDFLTGYFLLFKNTPEIAVLFTHSKDYQKVLKSPEHFCFDETNFRFNEFGMNIHYSEVESEIESMTHVVRRLEEKNALKVYFDFHVIEGVNGNLKWTNGVLIYKNKYEAILYHMILFKRVYNPEKVPAKMPDSFRVSKTRIYRDNIKQFV